MTTFLIFVFIIYIIVNSDAFKKFEIEEKAKADAKLKEKYIINTIPKDITSLALEFLYCKDNEREILLEKALIKNLIENSYNWENTSLRGVYSDYEYYTILIGNYSKIILSQEFGYGMSTRLEILNTKDKACKLVKPPITKIGRRTYRQRFDINDTSDKIVLEETSMLLN